MDKGDRDHYKDAGVDTTMGDSLVDWLREAQSSPVKPQYGEVVSGIGGFAALFRPNWRSMKDPLLVSSTDGVGTKVLLGLQHDTLEGLGVDLVAMCVNDLYTLGAVPLFFLDYYATGKLQPEAFKRILTGIRQGLKQCGTALIGGETAELPGIYSAGHFDLAGFVVGMVDSTERLGPHRVEVGDKLVALSSSGFHSNGYSLIRRWLEETPTTPALTAQILEPTRIYGCIPQLLSEFSTEGFHALAHITGGGISGNLPRVLPESVSARLDRKLLPTPEWMQSFIKQHVASLAEIEPIFNLGAGMIGAVAAPIADRFVRRCEELGFPATIIGETVMSEHSSQVMYV
jgi:phosphoribosylformylglycinamidine cyclo-ligase